MKKITRTVSFRVIAVVLWSCYATIATAATPRHANVKTIKIVSHLPARAGYLRIATTVFGNSEDLVPDPVFEPVIASIEQRLLDHGYKVVSDSSPADAILNVDPGEPSNYPSSQRVHGAGFCFHAAFPFHPPVEAQAMLLFSLTDGPSAHVIAKYRYLKRKFSKVKSTPKTWAEFSVSEKKELLVLLAVQLASAPDEAITNLGL